MARPERIVDSLRSSWNGPLLSSAEDAVFALLEALDGVSGSEFRAEQGQIIKAILYLDDLRYREYLESELRKLDERQR